VEEKGVVAVLLRRPLEFEAPIVVLEAVAPGLRRERRVRDTKSKVRSRSPWPGCARPGRTPPLAPRWCGRSAGRVGRVGPGRPRRRTCLVAQVPHHRHSHPTPPHVHADRRMIDIDDRGSRIPKFPQHAVSHSRDPGRHRSRPDGTRPGLTQRRGTPGIFANGMLTSSTKGH